MSSHYVLKIQYVNKPPETRNIGARVTVIGREAGDIVLGDPQSSGRHAEIHFENGGVRVKDLGSTNGTYFNGQRSPEFALQAGQGFSIGQTVMTLMAVAGGNARAGAGRTMIAMGGAPIRPPGAPGAPPPPGAPPGAPPFGRPPGAPPGPPPGAPPGPPAGFGAPPPGPPGAPPAPPAAPPGAPPVRADDRTLQGGFGSPPPGGGFGSPPPGAPPSGPGMAPPGSQPPGAPMGAAPMGAMAPAGMGAPMAPPPGPGPGMAPGGPAPMMSAPGGEIRGDFSGTGGELLGQLLVSFLLMGITFGLYAPWFICRMANYVAERTTFGPTSKGMVRMRFVGTGGQLFKQYLIGALLTMVTFGIYMPWFFCRMMRFFADNMTASCDDGSMYQLRFDGTGGSIIITYLKGAILTGLTFGIYGAWFMCDLNRWFVDNTKIMANGQQVGHIAFHGTGGTLLMTFIKGMLLTMVTFGIYSYWFAVELNKFNFNHTEIHVEGRVSKLRFDGTGGELFVITFVGMLLMMVTLGIYYFWFITKLLKWQTSNVIVLPQGAGAPAQLGGNAPAPMGPPMGGPPMGGPPMGGPPMGGPPPGGFGGPPMGGPPPGGGFA